MKRTNGRLNSFTRDDVKDGCSRFQTYGIVKGRKEGIVLVDRQGIIVYLHQLKHAKSLRKFGHVQYISRKMKYVQIYVDQQKVDRTIRKIERLPYVKKVVPSYRPFVETEYDVVRPDKAKEYDYKIGL